MPVFSAPDWPTKLWSKLVKVEEYPNLDYKCENDDRESAKKTRREKVIVALVVTYLSLQVTLPHSHWLTKGYNTWTNGLYGYSWDMMVHNWRHIHTRVTVVDKSSRKFYLNPEV